MMGFKLTDTDRGYKRIVLNLGIGGGAGARPYKEIKLSVGVHEEEGSEEYENDRTIVQVAAQHEFGVGVSQRSWLRGWFDNRSLAVFKHELTTAVQDYVTGDRPIAVSLSELGQMYVDEIHEKMDAGISPTLTPATIQRKEQKGALYPETPLEDTLLFFNAIKAKTEVC